MMAAYRGEVIIGGLGIFASNDGAGRFYGLLGMSVQKAFHGQGLGQKMMSYAIEQCRLAGLHRLELSVRTFNQPGIALYEKTGFRRIGTLHEVAFIDGKFVDEYLYELLLS